MYFKDTWRNFQPKPPKIKKIRPEKKSLYFRKWNFLALILKNSGNRNREKEISYFKKRKPWKSFLYSWKRYLSAKAQKNKKIHSEKNSLHFRKWNFLTLRLKNFLYFLKGKFFLYFLKKASNFLEMETPKKFLYFRKRNFLIFWESYIQNPNIVRTIAYLKPWHI